MLNMELVYVEKGADAPFPDLAGRDDLVHLQETPLKVAVLEGGMESGNASVALVFELPDGRPVLLESSAELFANAGVFAAIKGKTSVQPPHRESVARLDAALTALGASYRNDWSEFDGRTLRDQIGTFTGLMDRAVGGEDVLEAAEALRAEWETFTEI